MSEIDRINRRFVVALNKCDHAFTEEIFDLLLVQLDVLTVTIDDESHFLAWITETIEYLERATGAANCVNLERQHDEDLICMVQGRDGDRVEAMRRIDNDVIEPMSQQFHHFVNVFRLDVFSPLRLCRSGE